MDLILSKLRRLFSKRQGPRLLIRTGMDVMPCGSSITHRQLYRQMANRQDGEGRWTRVVYSNTCVDCKALDRSL
jgi:hypothetical protein